MNKHITPVPVYGVDPPQAPQGLCGQKMYYTDEHAKTGITAVRAATYS